MEKQIQILLNRLSGHTSYEEKVKWLNTGIVGNKSQMSVQTYIDKVPGLREQVNEHMMNTIAVEQGNPDAAGFTFSKEYSNEKLLEVLNAFEAGETKIANLFGETQVENTSDEILELQDKILKRNEEYKTVSSEITNLQKAIKTQRKEFDERAQSVTLKEGPFAVGGPLPFLGPVIPFFGKYLTQLTVGLTDLLQPTGLEKIENRDWNWDPKYKRIGPGPEMKETQDRLKVAYDKRADIPTEYRDASVMYEEYENLSKAQGAFSSVINNSGIDEALNFMSLEQLKQLLQEG